MTLPVWTRRWNPSLPAIATRFSLFWKAPAANCVSWSRVRVTKLRRTSRSSSTLRAPEE